MFNDIGPLELATIVVIAVLVFGPDKLPKVIQDITRTIRKIRDFSESAKQDIRTELGPEFKDFEFEDLNPKTFIRKQLGGDELGLEEIRSSFDMKKEMAELTDAVNGRASDSSTSDSSTSSSTSSSSSSGSTGGTVDMTKKADLTKRADLTKETDLTKKADLTKKPGSDERPVFDVDAT
ncbi:sec-independent translocase [Streptomyces sp. RY43-2]|uniref:Sec-independent protein translocase protein TatB n=1 Tax=Streptomyces macrolidinus TaxID=2952607 RepID=A0ABT0ZMR0_9ACTN|nr:sec-independent translocase [Streptomyces macrolidinus]MCN9244879.1 sec-independent translocase [Streptomyces macrolidinus]